MTRSSTSYVWAASMLSPNGRCRALDAAADGYVRGETVICIALTKLDQAAACTSAAVLVIRGSAVNQDGRSSSLTAPNGPAQQEVLHAALAAGNQNPASVAALSMHGTGTSLGDPIEVGAAMAVYASGTARSIPLAMAASKSWVGHAEPAAGLVGLLFACRAATLHQALSLMHLRTVNSYVASTLEQSTAGTAALPKHAGPLPLATTTMEVLCGVSAFAFQGTNTHALVQAVVSRDSLQRPAQATMWQRRHHHVLPEQHLLAAHVAVVGKGGNQHIVFETNLQCAALAFLWDHRVIGKCIFPGAVC